MDDFDIEDGSFFNWGGDSGGSSSFDFSFLDDLIPSGGVNPSSFDTSFLDSFDFNNYDLSFLDELIPSEGIFDKISSGVSDYFSDYDPTAFLDEYNFDALAAGLPNIGGEKVVFDDGSYAFVDPETGKILGGVDIEDSPFLVDESGRGYYTDIGADLGGTPEINFGGNLADKADVDTLFKYNAAIARGGYPVQNEDGSVTVKDKNGNDLFNVGNNGKITDIKKQTDVLKQDGSKKPPIVPGGNKNAALLAALLGGLLGLATKPKTAGGPRGFQSKTGGAPLTATRQALTPAGAPGSGGGRRFMSDVAFAAEGGLMDEVGYQPNQNVLFMKSGGIADLSEYIKMGAGMNAGDLRKADFLVRSGMSPDSAKDGISKVPDGMARGGLSDLGSYSDGGRMLKGPGDGMSDDIPATIGGKRPARLADGEFVVPADVVSHLGNGSTDAGADVLYDMMDKVRKARTGTKQQGKQINPKKYVPK